MSHASLLGAYMTGVAVGLLIAGVVACVLWSWLSGRVDHATTWPVPLDAEPDTQPIPLDLSHGEWTA